jgi:hypothetical protein
MLLSTSPLLRLLLVLLALIIHEGVNGLLNAPMVEMMRPMRGKIVGKRRVGSRYGATVAAPVTKAIISAEPLAQKARRGILASGATFLTTVVAEAATPFYATTTASISGGFLSGSLHAITGPDHIAALLPASVGNPWWYGTRIGGIWGLGHGISAIILGFIAVLVKVQMTTRLSARFAALERMSKFADSAVGFSLVLIGVLGIREAQAAGEVTLNSDGEEAVLGIRSNRAILSNGLLHGCSLDGAPSLAPALAMTSVHSAVTFLLSYCLGVIVAMSATAGAVGEGSLRLAKAANLPDLPKRLSMASSVLALIIGVVWVIKSLV